jgi:hypothetical protein
LAVTFNYTNQEINIYLNGSLTGGTQGGGVSGTINPGGNLQFAKYGFGATWTAGVIASSHMWNVELTESEIQQFMNCPPTGNESGLVGYWDFEEGTGTTANDLTSNGNDGTLTNGPAWSSDVPSQGLCLSCAATDTV